MNYYKLTDICDFQGGSQPPKNDWVIEPKDGYIRMLQIRDFTQNYDKPEYVKITNSIKTCREDDILIARYGASVGKILTGLSGAYNVAIMKTIPDERIIFKKYLYYFFKSKKFQNYILNVGSRAAQAGFNKDDLNGINIQVHSLDEQKNKVIKLEIIDNLISVKKRQIDKCNKLVKSQFVEMFGTPLVNENNYKVENAERICLKITDGSHYSPIDRGTGYPMLSVKDMRNDGFHYDNCKYISVEDYNKMQKLDCIPKKNDVLIAKDGSYFYYGFVVEEEREEAILSSIAMLRPNTKIINPFYLRYYMMSSEIVDLVSKNYVTGAALKRVILKGIKQIPVMIPNIDEQNRFENIVKQVDKQKFEFEKQLKKLEELQASLTQEYFG